MPPGVKGRLTIKYHLEKNHSNVVSFEKQKGHRSQLKIKSQFEKLEKKKTCKEEKFLSVSLDLDGTQR